MKEKEPTFEEHTYGREWRSDRFPLNFHFYDWSRENDLREGQIIGETSKLTEKDIEQWLVWSQGMVIGRAKNR